MWETKRHAQIKEIDGLQHVLTESPDHVHTIDEAVGVRRMMVLQSARARRMRMQAFDGAAANGGCSCVNSAGAQNRIEYLELQELTGRHAVE